MNIGDRAASLDTWGSDPDIKITNDYGSFKTASEAEDKALEIADSDYEDAIIVQEDGEFHVYGVDEIRDKFRGGWSDNTLYGAAEGTYALVMTDSQDDATERIAGTTDKSTEMDDLTSAFRKSGLSKSEAYHYTKYGMDKSQAQDLVNKLENILQNSSGFEGMKAAQARNMIEILKPVIKGEYGDYISPVQLRELMDIGDATSGRVFRD